MDFAASIVLAVAGMGTILTLGGMVLLARRRA